MKLPTHREFVDYINRHLEETKQKPSAFGRRVLNDSGAVPRLIEGTDPRLSTMHTIVDAIEEDGGNATGS